MKGVEVIGYIGPPYSEERIAAEMLRIAKEAGFNYPDETLKRSEWHPQFPDGDILYIGLGKVTGWPPPAALVIDIRDPTWHASGRNSHIAKDWHMDGHGNTSTIFWSNLSTTQYRIRNGDGQVWTPAPGSVVLYDNGIVEHRRREPFEKDRWAARIYETIRRSHRTV